MEIYAINALDAVMKLLLSQDRSAAINDGLCMLNFEVKIQDNGEKHVTIPDLFVTFIFSWDNRLIGAINRFRHTDKW